MLNVESLIKKLLSKRLSLVLRLIASLFIILYIIELIKTSCSFSLHNYLDFLFVVRCFCFILAIITFIKPYAFFIYGIQCYLYAVFFILERENPVYVILLSIMFIITIKAHSIFLYNIKIEKTIILISLLLLIGIEISVDIRYLCDTFLILFSYLIFSFCAYCFLFKRIRSFMYSNPKNDWDLSQYKEFSRKDKIILCQVLANKKYEIIAKEQGMGYSTLKKRLKELFMILDIPDKQGLFSVYSACDVFDGQELLFSRKKNYLVNN